MYMTTGVLIFVCVVAVGQANPTRFASQMMRQKFLERAYVYVLQRLYCRSDNVARYREMVAKVQSEPPPQPPVNLTALYQVMARIRSQKIHDPSDHEVKFVVHSDDL